ncbi:lipoyl(octanoyl) transferase LipB [Porphyromonas canoris]|uniref:lipoyl(octanoyl) transferase LipB n=1 Tax=Porphyromonas canoris TaxID=36875 RepID=UPI00068D6A7A|nr:lipoyl(octanoyl) transferase LipB [Porphyromonas canoris]
MTTEQQQTDKILHYTTLREIPYATGLTLQEQLFNEALLRKRELEPARHALISLTHTPVITMGKHADPHNILFSKDVLTERGVELHHTSRGGDVTYHGPGQLTVYPIIDLEDLGIGVKKYVWSLEEAVMKLLAEYGFRNTTRIEGASGVWVPGERSYDKVCAVGIYCSKYITMHGLALNVDLDTSIYNLINPCGFTDKGVTTMERLVSSSLPPMEDIERRLIELLAQEWGISRIELATF